MYVSAPDKSAFDRLGWQVVRGVFARAEIERLREACRELVREGKQDHMLLATPQLRDVVADQRLIDIARALLGGNPVSTGENSFLVGGHADFPTQFHKDNADRIDGTLPDWTEPYHLIRMGIYLQDTVRHSGGLALYESSHTREVSVEDGKVELHNGTMRFVQVEPGDVVIWSFKTSHRGNALRFKWDALNSLPKAIAIRLHRFPSLFVPAHPERYGIFVSYGLPGPSFERNQRYLASRRYAVESAQLAPFDADYLASVADRLPIVNLSEVLKNIPLAQTSVEHADLPR